MEFSLMTVLALDFLLVCLLPFIFFKNGKFNFMWMLTAFPYVGSLVIIGLHFNQKIPLLAAYTPLMLKTAYITSTVLAVVSIGLQCMTMGTHRIPLALWHQEDDAPVNIVTWGAYSRVRHPFYTSFILALSANLIAIPSIPTLVLFLYGVTLLTITARREERRLSQSEFGAEYIEYMKVTGRFFKLF